LREEAGINELVFARSNTVSLAQLKELELGGQSSFYIEAIKRSTGVKLLKKLGHDLVTPKVVTVAEESAGPSVNESASALASVMASAFASHPKAQSDSPERGLFQQTLFWTLGVLGLVALTAIKPWSGSQPGLAKPQIVLSRPSCGGRPDRCAAPAARQPTGLTQTLNYRARPLQSAPWPP
jgi:hypothetical protein